MRQTGGLRVKRTAALSILLVACLLSGFTPARPRAARGQYPFPVNQTMYRDGWTDFNKNGRKDVYEDPAAPLDKRIEDLVGQMTLDEKTCQARDALRLQEVHH